MAEIIRGQHAVAVLQRLTRAASAAVFCFAFLSGCDWGRRYVGMGDVVAVDADAHKVTIRHDSIPGLMDATTSQFGIGGDDVQSALTPGSRVRFVLRRNGDSFELTRVTVIAAGNPGMHDHTPHHGGIVAMAGMIHLEALASRDGKIALYLTDLWRRPLPLDDVSGTVTIDVPGDKRELPLAHEGDLLAATTPLPPGTTVNARFELRRAGEPVEVSFLLPLAQGSSGAAGIPSGGCARPAPSDAKERLPRCTLSFANTVVALGATPDASTLLVAQVDLGISAWRLPAGEFAVGFAPAPAVTLTVPEPPHAEAPNAVEVRPDGREVAVAMENRLIIYALDTGKVVRAFAGPGGIVRAATWSPDGTALLVSTFYTPAGFLLDAADGHVLRRLPVEREGAAVAFAPDGRRVAVASETGAVAIFDLGAAPPPIVVRAARASVRGLAFTGDAVVAVSEDGVIAIFDARSGAPISERRLGGVVHAAGFDVRRGVVATAGLEPRIQLTPIADGPSLDSLSWHTAQILSLTWAGDTLASGDAAGRVALWDVYNGD